ncbi:hypothetical protein [Halolamina salina]|uniref:Uncharacterized protein n=1 Tax=Halolamina salina TaxID=1220023 RepID=A0ABD6B3F1_9EURY
MADLQSCYFCGAPDELGEYAVVPPRLGGGDRSVALCPDCKTKLLRVMEPLIERAEGGDGASAEAADAADDSTAAQSTTGAHSDPGPATGGVTMSSGGSPESGGGGEGGGGEAGVGEAGGDGTGDGAGSRPGTGEGTPPSYRRAMRMLSNRPFPIERSEAESMLANAYDLEREEIDAVLSHAASEGRLVVEDGEIREP